MICKIVRFYQLRWKTFIMYIELLILQAYDSQKRKKKKKKILQAYNVTSDNILIEGIKRIESKFN